MRSSSHSSCRVADEDYYGDLCYVYTAGYVLYLTAFPESFMKLVIDVIVWLAIYVKKNEGH